MVPSLGDPLVRYCHYATTANAKGNWDKGTTTQYSSTGTPDPVVQFQQDGRFLAINAVGTYGGDGAVAPFLATRFVLRGTLSECQIIAESTQKVIRAENDAAENNMQFLYADADPGADVLRSKWTLGYIKGPLGPDGTIFDRS
jgi:hypothetical protein